MTAAQSARLRAILLDLAGCKNHPSPAVRASCGPYGPGDLAHAVARIAAVLKADDGWRASKIIGAWYDGSAAAVIEHLKRNP